MTHIHFFLLNSKYSTWKKYPNNDFKVGLTEYSEYLFKHYWSVTHIIARGILSEPPNN
jgi:hypothetical protein